MPVHFAENSVANGFSGGALHVDGEVRARRYAMLSSLCEPADPCDHLRGIDSLCSCAVAVAVGVYDVTPSQRSGVERASTGGSHVSVVSMCVAVRRSTVGY